MKYSFIAFMLVINTAIYAQENYEIQVYTSPTQTKNSTIFELHSNYTFSGEKNIVNKVRPTYHATHETIEITTGITNNFEIGIYLFTNSTPGYGFQVVGTHIRPRITAPLAWKLPVGLSMSAEIGVQKDTYSEDTWNVELRPILDKQWNKFTAVFNPTFGISLKGISNNHSPVFEPNVKLGYGFFKNINLGVEYYGGMGYVNHFETLSNQSHALYAVYDLTNNAKWELNFGVGLGLTQATEKWVSKLIIGRRINWK